MANRQTVGYGLTPTNTLGNTPATSGQSQYTIETGSAAAIYNGEPVLLVCNTAAGTGGFLLTAAAGTTGDLLGVLNGCFYNAATTLKPTWSNYYPAATAPANSENITAFVNDNPFQEYQIALSAALSVTTIAGKAVIAGLAIATSASGTTTGGKSNINADYATILATAKNWRILRSAEDPDNNDFTAAFANIIVMQNCKYSQLVVGV
jgi:hypothetical protein